MKHRTYSAAVLLERLVRDSYTDRRSSAIQPLQWSILRCLHSAGAEPLDVTTIAKYVGRTNPPVSRALTTLANRGLVLKGERPGSASLSVTLTAKGREALTGDPMNEVADLISKLPVKDCETFLQSVRTLAMTTNSFGKIVHDDDSGR